jgi:hypothetical protein
MAGVTRLFSSHHAVGVAVAVFSFAVYVTTLVPGVTFIDSGELAAVACTLGVAHPTGYPLFTLLGWLFSRLPIASEQIVRLNLMAAGFCAVGILVFFQLTHFMLVLSSKSSPVLRLRSKELQSGALLVAGASSSLLLAFSETYWMQAVAVEVYSLHLLLLLSVTLAFFKAAVSNELLKEGGDPRDTLWIGGWWMLFAFALGLSFANHMTTLLLAPGFLFLYVSTQRNSPWFWRRLLYMGVPFLLGLSVYLYLPLRASQAPAMNWGNTVTLERFLWHITGKQYRVWIFSSSEAAGRQFAYFVNALPPEFAYVGVAFALVGIVALWRARLKHCLTILLFFVGCIAYSINYDIHDIDAYFLLSYVSVALWAGIGMLAVIVWMCNTLRWKVPIVSALVICGGLAPLVYHYSSIDESKNHLVEDYTRNMFVSLAPNALILSYQWDYWVSASFYHQLVKGVRPDVTVVDKELLRRSWYLLDLERRHSGLVEQSRAEVDAFKQELDKFEHDQPYDPQVIQARFVDMIQSFIRRSLPSRPVYVTKEIEPEFTGDLQRVPEGLAFRLFPDTLFHPIRMPVFYYRPFMRKGRLEGMVPNLYSDALVSRGLYYYGAGDTLEARRAFRAALEYNPASVVARHWSEALGH